MKTTRRDDDLKLRELLRRGDPAQGNPPPGPQELARMRQELLEQAEAREDGTNLVGRRWAAAVASVVILVAVGWQLRNQSVQPPAVTEPPERITPPVAVDAEPVPAAPPAAEVRDESESVPPVVVASSDAGDSSPPPDGDVSAETLQARTVRFTTRGGTQIIWILDPELEL